MKRALISSCAPVQRSAGRASSSPAVKTGPSPPPSRLQRWSRTGKKHSGFPEGGLHSPRHPARPAVETVEIGADADAAGSSGFDWMEHWYPVMWEQDLLPGKPTKVILFDEDYCLLRRPESLGSGTMCLKDACPHRLAALSEGRMTSTGFLQCAYHGWSFNETGKCVDVPSSTGGTSSARTCSQAVPCKILGGHVWVFPGALQGRTPASDPPVCPEMMPGSGWKFSPFVRDLPIDYSVLVENIIDPDHGLFAHQASAFDWYTGNNKYPQQVEVSANGTGYSVTARVASANKLTFKANTAREELPKPCAEEGSDGQLVPKTSVVEVTAPCRIAMGRHSSDGTVTFKTMFWIVPTGLGRSRFLSCGAAKNAPFSIPRWILAVMTNNFLDQDTHLLATSQMYYLPWELQKVAAGETLDRRSLFCYQSPSENLLITVGRFFDENLPKMPNRYSSLAMDRAMASGAIGIPRRELVLDRWGQHTAICPGSQDALRNARTLAFTMGAVAVCGAVAVMASFCRALALNPQGTLLEAAVACLKRSSGWAVAFVTSAALALACVKYMAEFRFKYVHQMRDKDLAGIPKVYPDVASGNTVAKSTSR